MTSYSSRLGVLGLCACLSASAAAQEAFPTRGLNLITNSGNGVGNTIVVDNGGADGLTILSGVRNGIGNRVLVRPQSGCVLDLPGLSSRAPDFGACPYDPLTGLGYKGKDNRFYSQTAYSRERRCTVYWCPRTWLWYRYDGGSDSYLPLVLDREFDMYPPAVPFSTPGQSVEPLRRETEEPMSFPVTPGRAAVAPSPGSGPPTQPAPPVTPGPVGPPGNPGARPQPAVPTAAPANFAMPPTNFTLPPLPSPPQLPSR
jgi:hypothetical protein